MDSTLSTRSSPVGSWCLQRTVESGVIRAHEQGEDCFLWFTETAIFIGSPDAVCEMPYTAIDGPSHLGIDIIRKDRWEPWVDLGIVSMQGDTLQICTRSRGPRPTMFESTPENGCTLYVAVRCDESLPE